MDGTIFVVLQSHGVIFGKNTGRRDKAVLEVVYMPAADTSSDSQNTHINIQDVELKSPKKAVILNKSGQAWGAESGANECGIAIGCLEIASKYNQESKHISMKRLLAADLVRLALEYASSVTDAVNLITNLIEKYAQEDTSDTLDCNSFLIADNSSSAVLETYGKHWAVEEITSGYRCIGNIYSIGTNISKHSDGLQECAKLNSLWSGNGDFNFAKIFNTCASEEEKVYESAYKQLTSTIAASTKFKEIDMFYLLRSADLFAKAHCPIMGSQVSTLSRTCPSVHWFTGTQDPRQSVFKPFMFTPNAIISKHTVCPNKNEPHTLHLLHQGTLSKHDDVQTLLRSMEENCVQELDVVIETLGTDLSEFDELLKDCVETEVKFYR